MAYFSSTQASSIANPPVIIGRAQNSSASSSLLSTSVPGGRQGSGMWFYSSTNLTTDLVAANFFTDGQNLGMRPGDIVVGNQYTSAGSSVVSFQGTITQVSTNGAQLSTGGLITSTFNAT